MQLATINNPKLLPYGAWQTPDSFIIHDRKYRPLVRLAAHEDQDEPSEALGNADLPGGIDCHARGGVPSFIRVRPETAQVVDPSERIEHEEGWAYWFEPDRARLQDLVNSIPELAAEIQRRDAADIVAKKVEREAFEQHAEANARYRAGIAAIQAKPPLQVTESDLRELPIRERLQMESKIMMERRKMPVPPSSNVVSLHQAAHVTPLPLTFFDECRDRSPKHWIFKGVFAKGENSSIFGAPGTLKSAFLNDAAVHAAAGKDWRGFKNKERCGVVYFAFERADQVRRRLAAYATRDSLKDLPIAVAGNIVDMLDPGCVDIVVATIRAAEARFGVPVGFIIFDTWSKGIAAGGGDEDKARDQNIIAANLRRIHEHVSVHIAGVGHSGKDETRGERGSNARQGDVDLQIQISGDTIKTATVIKANDQPEGPLTSYAGEVVVLGTDEDGDPITAFILSTRMLPAIPKAAKRNPRHDIAMGALHKAVAAHGQDIPAPVGLGGRAVALDRWRDELFECGFIAHDAANPRADFKRVKEALTAGKRITIRNEFVWPIGAPPPQAPVFPSLGQ